jgi:hypothetical protein
LAAPDGDNDETAATAQGTPRTGKLKVVFSHIAYDIFRLVAAFAQRMVEMNARSRAAVEKLDLQAMSRSITTSKVLIFIHSFLESRVVVFSVTCANAEVRTC